MRKLSKHRPLPINVDLDALHLQSEGDLEDHGLASLDVPVEALTAATLRDPVALESRLLEADRYLGRLTRGAATLREDLVLLVPYLVFLAEFSADQGSASRTASPKGATQVATPWGSATRLHAGGVGRPTNEALYLAAFSADYLLWNAGVDDPERAARVIRALFGLGFVGHIEHYDTARHATAVGALVRERDAYLRMGREILIATGSLPLLPLEYRIPPDVARLLIVVQRVRRMARQTLVDVVLMSFGSRAMAAELLPLAVAVGPESQATWDALVRDSLARGLRPGGVQRIDCVSRELSVSTEALRELAPSAQVSLQRQPAEEMDGAAVLLAERSAALITQRRTRRGADLEKERRIAATEMLRIMRPSLPAVTVRHDSD